MNHFRCSRCAAEFMTEGDAPPCPDCRDRFAPQLVVTTTLRTADSDARGSNGVRFTLIFAVFVAVFWVLTEGGTLLGMTISSAQTRGWIIVAGALGCAWLLNALATRPTQDERQ